MKTDSTYTLKINEHITLRIRTTDEAQELFDLIMRNKTHLSPWMSWINQTDSEVATHLFIEKKFAEFMEKEACDFGIYYDDAMIGSGGFHTIDTKNKVGYVGYWIAKEYEGQGIITLLVRALIETVAKEYNIHRVVIELDVNNVRSRAVPRRLGFTHEGTLRDHKFYEGQFHTHEVWGFLISKDKLLS